MKGCCCRAVMMVLMAVRRRSLTYLSPIQRMLSGDKVKAARLWLTWGGLTSMPSRTASAR